MRRYGVGILAALFSLAVVIVPALGATTSFDGTADFRGQPAAPVPFRPVGWDVTVLGTGDGTQIVPMLADHGPQCQGPPTTYAPDELAAHMHQISTTAQAVYQCADHVMTSIWSGYGAIYLTPPSMMDFSQSASIASLTWTGSTVSVTTTQAHGFHVGDTIQVTGNVNPSVQGSYTVATAPSATTLTYASKSPLGGTYTAPANTGNIDRPSVLDWNMSTRRTGSRDWIDVVVMPWAGNDQLNFIDVNVPNDAVHVQLAGGGNVLLTDILRNARPSPNWSGSCSANPQPTTCHIGGDTFHTWDYVLAQHGLTTSPARRDHFRLELSRNHVKVSMPDYGFVWTDEDIVPPLTWSQGIVQLNQRTYNVEKSCSDVDDPNPPYNGLVHTTAADNQQTGCAPNTWHWSDVKVSPALPFSIIPAVLPGGGALIHQAATVHFAQPAPENSWFHGAGGPYPNQISYDGVNFHNLATVGPPASPEQGNSYWEPMPAGTQDVMIRGSGQWSMQDMSIWSLSQVDQPTPTPAPTALPTATAPPATSTPTSVPPTETPTPTAGPTNTPTPVPTTIPTTGPTTGPTATPTPTATGSTCALAIAEDGTVTGQCQTVP